MRSTPIPVTIIALAIAATAISACRKEHPASGGKTGSSNHASGDAPATGAALDEQGLHALLVKGYKLYWEVPAMKAGGRSTIDGRAMVMIDPAKAPTAKALRLKLGAAFTDVAIDSIFADFGVREHEGRLWMNDVPADDVSNYEEAEVSIVESDSLSRVADVEVPLGDSGQIDELTVRATRVGGTWKLATSPYGGSDLSDDDGGN